MKDLLADIARHFATDPTTAGITVAYLPDRNAYYASVCRYTERLGQGKVVVVKCVAVEYDQCIECLTALWENYRDETRIETPATPAQSPAEDKESGS